MHAEISMSKSQKCLRRSRPSPAASLRRYQAGSMIARDVERLARVAAAAVRVAAASEERAVAFKIDRF